MKKTHYVDYNEPIKYIGNEEVNAEFHHGGIRPAIGVNSIQVLRCNRENPQESEEYGWTYNHAPMLAFHNSKFYLEYLSTPKEEHVPPGHTMLTISNDGINWGKPRVVFPEYKIPDGIFEYNGQKLPSNTYAVMHQRMGFYLSKKGRLLILGNYGICPTRDQVPFGKFSIGRVVREIYPDDSFGPIYFLRYNKGTIWNESNTHFPFYKRSDDSSFIEACEELMADRLVTQQWAEEQGDVDELITIKSKDGAFYNKAFCWYKLDDGTIIGLWKWMKCAVSHDGGRSWSEVVDIPTIKHAGAKIWGQRTSDGRYALVYNPHTNNKHRWPLAVAVSEDGLIYKKLNYVVGDVSPIRYEGGPYKDFGMNYVRGIEINEGKGPDEALYAVYSMNKEDVWISRIPVPIDDRVTEDVHDDFENQKEGSWVEGWNIYSPKWAPVGVIASPDGHGKVLKIEDFDPYDYAKAERVFKESSRVRIDICIMSEQNDVGALWIELVDKAGKIACRVIFDKNGELKVNHGRGYFRAGIYEVRKWYTLSFVVDTLKNIFDVELDGTSLSEGQRYQEQTATIKGWFLLNSVKTVEKLVMRTSPVRRFPNIDTSLTEVKDLENAGIKASAVRYFIKKVDIC